jgi:hypothetical protein
VTLDRPAAASAVPPPSRIDWARAKENPAGNGGVRDSRL